MAPRYKDRPKIPWIIGHYYETRYLRRGNARFFRLVGYAIMDQYAQFYWSENIRTRKGKKGEGRQPTEVGEFFSLYDQKITLRLLKQEEMEQPRIHEQIRYVGPEAPRVNIPKNRRRPL